MEPDEETKRDPVFAAQHGCVPEHFDVEASFKEHSWDETLKVIDDLEQQGYGDRYLTTMKAMVFARMGDYPKALTTFKEALEETYKCKLTAPRLLFKITAVPAIADEAILWFNIYQVYEGLGDPKQAATAFRKAKSLLREAVENELSSEKFESFASRLFHLYSIFRDPL